MIAGTLSRYFAMRFVGSVVGSLIGVIALAAMIDYVELMRRGESIRSVVIQCPAVSRMAASLAVKFTGGSV